MDMTVTKPKMVSLFSGCGGLDLGFKKAGFDIIWANDFDADAQAVYRRNLGEIDGRDILTVSESEIPDCDILTAGFPCQPFSNAGNRKGVHDSRGMLYKECLRMISAKMPKVIVFENVKGLLSTKYIDGRNLADVIVEDLSAMNDTGYDVVHQLINASDYGVPQNRQRVLFVGIRKDLGITFSFPEKQARDRLTLGDVLDIPGNVPNHVDWPLSPQALEMISFIPEGGSWKDVPYEHLAPRFQKIRDDMKKYHSPKFYRRFARDEICGTMTASAQPENCGIIHPTQNRRFTIREVARIQTFPDDFIFIDDGLRNITAMYKVIGNAVPVNMAYAIASAIMSQVFHGNNQNEAANRPMAAAADQAPCGADRRAAAMNTDKAYLLGLIIGGGIFGEAEDVFRIRLPYKKWGSYLENPRRAGEIAGDILRKVGQMFRAVYGLSIQYETTPGGIWTVLCEGDISDVKADLSRYGISPQGELRGAADISELSRDLVDDNLKRRFIAGLADTIGSMAKSQRRFTAEHQIISFEIKGHNFKSVCNLCHLLYSVNCIPDQVNWNHPNMHCPSDPYYKTWSKGFKLRILLDQYARFGAFAFRTKAETSAENRRLQQQTHTAERCEEREINVTPSSVHPAENDPRLPDTIRGGHYLHFRHFCAVLGCEHAPYDKICSCFENLGEFVNPFPILHRDTYSRIEDIVRSDHLLAQRDYSISHVPVSRLLAQFRTDRTSLIFGSDNTCGYPIAEILQATAYIIANDDELFGKRPKKYLQIIERHLAGDPDLSVEVRKPDLLTPLIITGNDRGALVGAANPAVYSRLISRAPDNAYKLLVRQITEEDLRNAGPAQ
ncbi:MAG: DNA cytosine methyltransferase [Oscillospiraceae bacterium]|nr:DNA cytosine methyltransferase [Oscillospiraceae bacterium]